MGEVCANGRKNGVQIGGTGVNDGNIIGGNSLVGIGVQRVSIQAYGAFITPQKLSILGNSIYDTTPASSGPFATSGLGIDLFTGIDTDSSPDGVANTYADIGVTANDASDPDIGPNNYINFPVLNSFTQNGSQATVNLDLDAADSPSDEYRVEFFANDTTDPSGYGEGQIYLGAATLSSGDNQ